MFDVAERVRQLRNEIRQLKTANELSKGVKSQAALADRQRREKDSDIQLSWLIC